MKRMLFLAWLLFVSTRALAYEVVAAEFGVFDATDPQRVVFSQTSVVPRKEGQRYGWMIELSGVKGSVSVREEYVLPGSAIEHRTDSAEVHNFIMMLLGKLVEDVLLHLHAHLLLHLFQFILLVGLSPYNIELATAALSFWVYLISQTGCTQGTTLVEKLWINELGRDGIVRTTCAQHLAFRSAFAVWIAALNHKILDDTMEESAIEISLLCQLQEVVTMLRGLVVEAHLDVAL